MEYGNKRREDDGETMKIKLAFSPLWAGVAGLSTASIILLLLAPNLAESWVWLLCEAGLLFFFLVGALVHGHFKWKRKQHFQHHVVDLGGNNIGIGVIKEDHNG